MQMSKKIKRSETEKDKIKKIQQRIFLIIF